MECAAHPDHEATGTCASCKRTLCSACTTYDVDGKTYCEACGRNVEQNSHSIGSALLASVAVGYLATLALGVALFGPKPFVGGLAAIAGIALGRLLQVVVRPPSVTRRQPLAP
ncbi:hypothetical protein AKJ09_07866 [Labilithrix luteola]|uniref:B box-type domain-containing protein n=1 Tax=Labilithrix luteola TaxID=1391654 RepID=A0A0K1Q659_9BACT|nr:hypothetical protein [Labilithrix luteola]AKV01203.1 hypothetical protein AKJ09_07866 [Labilithrix luteola]